MSNYEQRIIIHVLNTVEPLLADTPNSGQYAMYQLLFPYILYFKNSLIADTPNSYI